MANAVFFNSYKLKEGASASDFLIAFEQLIQENISKHSKSHIYSVEKSCRAEG